MLVLSLLLTLMPSAIFAEEVNLEERPYSPITINPIAPKVTPSTDSVSPYSLLDPNLYFITDMTVDISVGSDGKVNMYGSIYTNKKVDSIKTNLTLERWNGTRWITAYSSPYVTETQVSSVQVYDGGITPLKGYSYRAKLYVQVNESYLTEAANLYSFEYYISN